jgi:hypothetical protein
VKRWPLSVIASTVTLLVTGDEKTAGVGSRGEGKTKRTGRGREIVEGEEDERAMEVMSRASLLETTRRRSPDDGSEEA